MIRSETTRPRKRCAVNGWNLQYDPMDTSMRRYPGVDDLQVFAVMFLT